ncbi:hypothetical protein AUJ78_00075 [Candidatus Peregrinibacteria bacterium CG1_02_41_10]|nr:MAG: hypothetical protein AUJ78_00075 [Candidatus Peregrinibacteria bacterium CG1_02_41_10]
MSKLYLIDGNNLLYRAFYAVKDFRSSKGIPTNAIFGFTRMLFSLIKEEQPEYLAVVFDAPGKNFRHVAYEKYKLTRAKMPEDLIVQRPYVEQIVRAMQIALFQIAGVEADDVIGTLARVGLKNNLEVVVISSDKDLMQLVNEEVKMLDTMKKVLYTKEKVQEKLGVLPEKVIDLISLMGDSSDNIPGVPGVGPKTALQLIDTYGSLKKIYENVDQVKGKLQERLRENEKLAFLSYELATIHQGIPEIKDLPLGELKYQEPDWPLLKPLFEELEFRSFLKEDKVAPDSKLESQFRLIQDEKMFQKVIEEASRQSIISLDTETSSENPFLAELVGISLSWRKDEGYYLPLAHRVGDNLDKALVLEELRPILESAAIAKIGQNLKYDLTVLEREYERMAKGKGQIANSKEQMAKGGRGERRGEQMKMC